MKAVLCFAAVLVFWASVDAIPAAVYQVAVDKLGPSFKVVKVEITGTTPVGKYFVNTVLAVGERTSGSWKTTKSCTLSIHTDVHGDAQLRGYNCNWHSEFSYE